ncbi:TPA: DNA starvation/stationary phase protection protein [bacterium]|nr:DNA starvation/stationary phase protection protein [bacterium]
MNTNLLELLNKEVANFGVLYIKLHNYHWFVKGNNFYTLHEKFEEIYDETTAHLDEIAERLVMLNYKPAASLKEFLELTSLKEATGNESEVEMVNSIINDLKVIDQEFAKGIELADEANDDVSADMITGIRASLQKHIWMLTAFLG